MTDRDANQSLAEYLYGGVRARFTGLEANGNLRLQGPDGFSRTSDGSTLDLAWRADVVRATNLDTGEPLPRIAPLRIGATLVYGNGRGTRGLASTTTQRNAECRPTRARPRPTRCGTPRSPTA